MSGDVLVTGDGTLADLAWPIVATAVRSATFVALSLRATVSARDCERALVHDSGPFLEHTTETEWYGHGQPCCSPFVSEGPDARERPEAAALERRYAVYRDLILRQSIVELGMATFRRKPVDRVRHKTKAFGERESLQASRDPSMRVSACADDAAATAAATAAPAAFDVQTFRFFFIMDRSDDTPVVPCFLATPAALRQLSGHARDGHGYRSDGCWRGKPATASEQLFDSDSGQSDETDDVDAELVAASASTSAHPSMSPKGAHREAATTSRCRQARAHSENVLSFALRQGIRYLPPRWQLLDRKCVPSNAATMPLQLGAVPDIQTHRGQYAVGEILEPPTRAHYREPTSCSLAENQVHSNDWNAPKEWTPLPPTLAQGEGADLFRMLAESHIPLVFFDGLYDVMSMYEAFYAPLPPSLDAFLSRLALTMPQVVDVRCLAALMKLSDKRFERIPGIEATTPQLSGDVLLARMVRIALRSAIVNHRHLLQSIRGGKWFVNHPRSKALRREARALEEKRAAVRAPSLQTADGRLPSPVSAMEDDDLRAESLSGQAAEGAPTPLSSIHLDEMLSENNEPTSSDAFASLLLVPLAKSPENHAEDDVMTTSTEAEPLSQLDPFSDAPLDPTDAQELLAALEDMESTADITVDLNLLPETLSEHMSGAALRAFRTGAVLAYLLERHGWSTVMDRFRGCIATGSDDSPVYLPWRRGEGDKSTFPNSTDPTRTPTKAAKDLETQACTQCSTGASAMTHGITEGLNGCLATGQLKDNRSIETPARTHENPSVSQVSSGPTPTHDARTGGQPIDWVTSRATAIRPQPGFVVTDKTTSLRRTRNPTFVPDDPLTHEWTQRFVSLIAPNTLTEALHERALLAVGSVAQRSLGAHTFAIGAHTEKTYLWESNLDIGIFLAGVDPPASSDDIEHGHTVTPAARSPASPSMEEATRRTRPRLGRVDDTDKPPAPNETWPIRIASALCEAAARLADRPSQIVAAPNDPPKATRTMAPCGGAGDAADAMACSRLGRGPTLQPAIRRRSRRRRRRRREAAAASVVQLPAEVSCLSLSEEGVACRLVSDGDANVVCVPEPDHLACADVMVSGSPHSSSGDEQSPERRLSGLVRDHSEGRRVDTDADLSSGLESIDSLTIERAANAGVSGLVIRCAINGLRVRLMLNPATALCRSRFLAECDEIIGHKHVFIRCLLLLKAWWRYSPAASQVKAAQPRSVRSLSSVLLAALLLSYLNHVEHPSEHPVQVLHGLFQFYGFELDWSRYGMSIHGPYEGEQGSLLPVSSTTSSRLPLLPLETLRSHMIEYASCLSSRTTQEVASYHRWWHDSDSGVDAAPGAMNNEFWNRNAFQSAGQASPFFLNVLDPLDPEWNVGLQAIPTPILAQACREAFRLAASQLWSFRQCPTRERLEACWGVRGALEPVWSLICNTLGNDAALLLQRAFDDISSGPSFNGDTGDVFDENEGAFGPTCRLDASPRFWSLLRLYGLAPAHHFTREQQSAGGGIALHGTGNYNAEIDGGLFILPDVAQLKEHLAYVRFLVQFDTSEAGILAFLLQTLRRSGSLLVGELGQQLRSRMSKHTWQTLFKTRYGGLKRFLERHPDLFCIEQDHPLNPHVSLRF